MELTCIKWDNLGTERQLSHVLWLEMGTWEDQKKKKRGFEEEQWRIGWEKKSNKKVERKILGEKCLSKDGEHQDRRRGGNISEVQQKYSTFQNATSYSMS